MQIAETFLCSCCLQQWRVLRGDVALARLQLSRGPQLETELHNPPSVGSSPHTATQQTPRLFSQCFRATFFVDLFSKLMELLVILNAAGLLDGNVALGDS